MSDKTAPNEPDVSGYEDGSQKWGPSDSTPTPKPSLVQKPWYGGEPEPHIKDYLFKEHGKHIKAFQAAVKAKYPDSDFDGGLDDKDEVKWETDFFDYLGHKAKDPMPFINWAQSVVPDFATNPPAAPPPKAPAPLASAGDDPWGDEEDSYDPDNKGPRGDFAGGSNDWFVTATGYEDSPVAPNHFPEYDHHAERLVKQSAKHIHWLNSDEGKSLNDSWADRQEALPMEWNGINSEMSAIADRVQQGEAHWEDLYRCYKHTPHQPVSVLLKYFVHRHNNVEAYDDPQQVAKLDEDFLKLHQYGKAGKKNKHLTPFDLHTMVQRNPKLLTGLLAERDRIQKLVLQGTGLNVRTIGGQPYVALTRGLDSDIMSHEHALSSWSDDPGIGFGNVKHHAWVPLKDLWYSFDMGPRYPSGNHGPETEYLMAHTAPRYEANEKGEDTHRSRFRDWNDKRKDFENFHLNTRAALTHATLDSATDAELADTATKFLTGAQLSLPDGDWRTGFDWKEHLLNHKNAGPLVLKAVTDYFAKMRGSADWSALFFKRAAPADWVMSQFRTNHAKDTAHVLNNPNLSADHITEVLSHPDINVSGAAAAILNDRKPNPNLNTDHMRLLHQRLLNALEFTPQINNMLSGRGAELLKHPLTPKDVVLDVLKRIPNDRTLRANLHHFAIQEAQASNAAFRDPEVGDELVKQSALNKDNTPPGNLRISDDFATRIARGLRSMPEDYDVVNDDSDKYGIDIDVDGRMAKMSPWHMIKAAEDYASQPDTNPDIANTMIQDLPFLRDRLADGVRSGFRGYPLNPRVQLELTHLVAQQWPDSTNKRWFFEGMAKQKGLSPATVEYLLHVDHESPNSYTLIQSVLADNKDPAVHKAVEDIARREGVEIQQPTYDPKNDIAVFPNENAVRAHGGVGGLAGSVLLSRLGWELTRKHRHLIKPWPEGLAKSELDPMYAAQMHEWLSNQKRKHNSHEYHYPTHYRDAMAILNRGTLHPKPTEHLLHGYAVFAHTATDDPYHIERRLDSAHREDDHPVILHFQTDEQPDGIHDGQHYWTREIPIRSAHVAHQRENPLAKSELAKMAIQDIAPGKLVYQDSKRKHYDYSHLLPPMKEMKGLEIRVRQSVDRPRPDVEAQLLHNGKQVGEVGGCVVSNKGQQALEVHWANLDHRTVDVKGVPLYHGKRFGEKLYEAVLAHAKHIMGATAVQGGNHSSRAHAAWVRLAAKHGLGYTAREIKNNDPIAGEDDLPGSFDEKYSLYQFKLAEMAPVTKAVFDMGEPLEKATQLGMLGVPNKEHFTLEHEETEPDAYQRAGGIVRAKDQSGVMGELHYSVPREARHGVIHAESILVKPEHQGKGVGTALLNHLRSKVKGYQFISADTTSQGSMNHLARRFGKPVYLMDGIRVLTPEEARERLPAKGTVDEYGTIVGSGMYGEYKFTRKPPTIKKSLNLQGKNALESWELETALMMLGHHPHAARALKAAHWLSGRKLAANDDVYQMALRIHDGDHERAALHAYGLTDSEKNLKALRAMMENPDFAKSEDVPPAVYHVHAAFPEGEETAAEVKRAVEAMSVQTLKLSGKHSKGSMAAKDPTTGNVWLLKPGSGKVSPAAGVDECEASQSRREACFWQVANEFQMGSYYPHCDLLMVNEKEWAAMRLLASTFDNLDKKTRKSPEYALKVLEPYRQNGTIHRWAVLDWVLGNPDRHGQNLMVDKQGNLALIDHGSAFAGDSFNPAFDSKSFIPFYLRAWGPKDFFELQPEDRMRFMPEVDGEVDAELEAWLETITPQVLGNVLVQYGIDPGPALRRLDMLKPPSPHSLCTRINALWAGYELDDGRGEEYNEPMSKSEATHPFSALEQEYQKVWGKTPWPACNKVAAWAVGALSKQGVKARAVQGYMDGNPEHYHWWAEAHHGGKRWIIDGARAQFQMLTGDKRPFAVFPQDHKEASGYQLEADE